jgi:uncharacterized protein
VQTQKATRTSFPAAKPATCEVARAERALNSAVHKPSPERDGSVQSAGANANSLKLTDHYRSPRPLKMFGWFQALMPKEERFFMLFEKHAAIIVAGAEALRGLLQGGDSIEEYCKQIFQHEAEADNVTREVLIAVRRTFITPFDRTDIQDLITSMDDAIDQMNKTAKTIVLFEVRSFEPQMQHIGEIILQSAKLVLEAVPLLSAIGNNAGRLGTLTTKIITIEEEADDLYNRGLKALFLSNRSEEGQGNAMKFVVGSELYDHLEKVVDRFEDVANEINSIVIDQL